MLNNVTDNLTPKQERALVAMLNEHNVSKAAVVADVHEQTLYRWLREPGFSGAYRAARREAFGQAIALTQRYAPLAVNSLAKILMDDKAPHTSKVNAATAILRFGREGIELDDLAARVEALESQSADGPSASARFAQN